MDLGSSPLEGNDEVVVSRRKHRILLVVKHLL